jgi:two-component sensor histidine kinase
MEGFAVTSPGSMLEERIVSANVEPMTQNHADFADAELLPHARHAIEFQHRLKNLLAITRAIAARTAENSLNLEEFAAHFDGRLAALSRTQKFLARAATFKIDLEEMVRAELLSHCAEGLENVTVAGPHVLLSQKAAENLGLAMHELVTNAVKFGALSFPYGKLAVGWRIDQPKILALEWKESAAAPIDPAPARNGFGREFLERGLPYQLRANTHLEFHSEGVCCLIELPLAGNAMLYDEGSAL